MIPASDEIRVEVIMELCQHVLDGKRISTKWQSSVVVLIYKQKGDVMGCLL